MAVVSAPLAGRLLPPASGRLPRLGERVEQGQILGWIEPALTTSDGLQLATFGMELMLRDYDLQARALEVELASHQSRARLDFAAQALARVEGLRAKDLGTEVELEAARRDLELARRDGESAQALMEALGHSRQGIAALRARAAQADPEDESRGGRRHPLLAPISAEIIAAEHVEGEFIDAEATVYRLLDPDRVWIAAHLSEFDLGLVGEVPGALLEFAPFPERRFDVEEDLDGRLMHIGREVDPTTRTVTLRFEAINPDGLLRVGMNADVWLETERAEDCVALPEEAIVMDQGRPVAFVLLHGEAFQKRLLELGIRDGGLVEIRSGIEAGERVVTRGATLVKLAAASPASFGEGHAH
jgi:multidrug efflux pump subunit AcrA (membrane-fusion protein)